MLTRIAIAAGAAVLAGTAGWATAQTPASSQPASPTASLAVVGLSVARPASAGAESPVRVLQPGTRIHLNVSMKNGQVLALDERRCEITTFTDDKQSDLKIGGAFGAFPELVDDGAACQFTIESKTPPARGARELRIVGSAGVITGSRERKASHKNVALKADQKVEAGPLKAVILKAEPQKWGDEEHFVISLESKTDLRAVKAIRFLAADGSEMPAEVFGEMRSDFTGVTATQRDYKLKQKADVATIEVTYYQDLQTIIVPLDLRIGVGL